MAARVYASRIFVGADDPYPLCPFGASPPDRGSRPHRSAGAGSEPLGGCFACGRVTFCTDRKSPKNRLGKGGFRIVPTPFVSLRSTFPPDRGNRPPFPKNPFPLKRPKGDLRAPFVEFPQKGCTPEKDAFSAGAACGRPRADETSAPTHEKRPARRRNIP